VKTNRERVWVLLGAVLSGVAACTSQAQEEPVNDLVQMVVDLLHEEDKEMRSVALDQVRTDCKGQAATERFAVELSQLPPEAQAGLLNALGDRGDRTARPAVLEMLERSDEPSVIVAAIRALGHLGLSGDTRQLVRILAQGSDAEQIAARESLTRLQDDKVLVTIAAEMEKAPAPIRIDLIEILTTRRALEMVPAILAAAVDDEPSVRVAAMASLGKIGSPEHLPGLVQGVLKADRGRERDAAEKCVMQVCSRIEDRDKQAAPLLDAIRPLNESDQQAMLPTVGRVGGQDALQAVEAAIAAEDSELHGSGIRALCNWPEATIAPRLIELVKTEDHPAHRTAALRALIRVAPLSDERTDADRLELLRKAMEVCTRDDERMLVLDRARTIRTLEALRFVLPYLDQPAYAEQACLSVVELAHHRGLREPNKAEFDSALDKVLDISKDATVLDRAQRYKLDQTWVRPERAETPVAAVKPKNDDHTETTEPASSEDVAVSQPEPSASRPAGAKAGIQVVALRTLTIVACIGIVTLGIILIAARNRKGYRGE